MRPTFPLPDQHVRQVGHISPLDARRMDFLLGLPVEKEPPIPERTHPHSVIAYYDGWTTETLATTPGARQCALTVMGPLLSQYALPAQAGYYELLFCMTNESTTMEEMLHVLRSANPDWGLCPASLLIAVLLAWRQTSFIGPLGTHLCVCAEIVEDSYLAILDYCGDLRAKKMKPVTHISHLFAAARQVR